MIKLHSKFVILIYILYFFISRPLLFAKLVGTNQKENLQCPPAFKV